MRPQDLYAEVLRQRETDGQAFFALYHDKFVEVACPVCGNNGIFSFVKYGFLHRTCGECHTLFCSPRPPEDLLSLYYTQYKAPQLWTELVIKTDALRKSVQYLPRVEAILAIIKQQGVSQGGRALDIGAGSGAFSLCLKNTKFFHQVIALDISEPCVHACQSQGLEAQLGTIFDIADDSFDFVCTNDFIEHLFDPGIFLEQCFRILRKGGYLSIATPNGEGFDFKILREKTNNITPPEHLTYLNPVSLSFLLKRTGFSPVSILTPGKLDVEIIQKEKASGYPLADKNQYIDYLLGLDEQTVCNFQKFLVENGLSSHMVAVAHK